MRKVDWKALLRRERAASALNYRLIVGLVAVVGLSGCADSGIDCGAFTAADENTNKGTQCSDGTFYIGHHDYGDGNGQVPLFAAGCDVGMEPGSDGRCGGSRRFLEWGPVDPDSPLQNVSVNRIALDYSGRESTATLVRAGGYPAAEACEGLTMNGHRDWYLPAMGELDLMWAATHARATASDGGGVSWLPVSQGSGTALAQTFHSGIFSKESCGADGGFPCAVWSASQSYSGRAWGRDLSNGGRYRSNKNNRFPARCVRR